MPITFHEKAKQFHLYNDSVSYIMKVMPNGQLGNLYYGTRLFDREDFGYLFETGERSHGALSCPPPVNLCLQYTRQEYPAYGTGDYRYGACTVKQENGSRITNFTYRSYRIFSGKKLLDPLPSVYTEDEGEAMTLEILLHDDVIHTDLLLSYVIYEAFPVLTRHACFIHRGDGIIVLENAMSGSIDLPEGDFMMLQLSGAWSRERQLKRRKLEQGITSIYSMRGVSSAEHNPFLALVKETTGEEAGEVYGFCLIYSGSFLGQAEVCSHDTTRILMGIHPDTFEWPLKKGERFQTPELILYYGRNGLGQMSRVFHRLFRTRLARGYWRDRERPVLLNNWEATYMNFNEEKILTLAEKAKAAGIELFVLDDGWFGERDDDDRGLGDWFVNRKKLPSGIGGLSRKIEAMGMKFGLWIEPEMVNKNSSLYRNHPDWILSAPGRYETPSRRQHVLDFSRKEVVDCIYSMLKDVISEAGISYIKWDMNRYLTECYSRGTKPEEQGMVMHRCLLGVYELYSRLINDFPEILFESCASGGARFDPGMLYFAPQAWCSDNTDAVDRLKIQYGTSMVYPISSIGAHVSESPNQQVGRRTPMVTRGSAALFGAFGFELDLNHLGKAEFELVRKQTEFYKQHRMLLHQGDFYRLISPFEENAAAWMVVSQDRKKGLAMYCQILNPSNAGYLRLKFAGLKERALYEITLYQERPWGAAREFYGSELLYAGLPIDRARLTEQDGDFASVLIEITEK